MPRQARIDIPGALHHIICRGIERRKIFQDDTDRDDFVGRLGDILRETTTPCLAWALIPNPLHLLLVTGAVPIATVMRRLLTGYAVTYNRRHQRHGHLFQNRYKSILCQEEPYLLELVLKEADEKIERRQWLQAQGYDFQKVVSRAGELIGMDVVEVIKPGKQPRRVMARSLVYYWAVLELGLVGASVAKMLGMSQPAVSKAVQSGRKLAADKRYSLSGEKSYKFMGVPPFPLTKR